MHEQIALKLLLLFQNNHRRRGPKSRCLSLTEEFTCSCFGPAKKPKDRKHRIMSWENTDTQKNFAADKKGKTSGLTLTWRLWRHCCCRYGWYPLLVAVIVTTGWLSSLYSSAGCDFIRLDIGFTPSNEAWNQSTAELGLFVYQSGESSMNKYHEAFVDGCQWYEDTFNEDFIEHDRTWKVARIMAYISFLSSALAMV